MLFASATSLFATAILLSTASAAPTRTHCRCTIVADAAPAAIFTPSAAHWTPAESSQDPQTSDICTNLGPELENFQHTEPDLYASYLSQTEGPSTTNDHQKVFVNTASINELRARKETTNEPRPTSRPRQRVVCHSEPDPFDAYHTSFLTLWILQIIVAIAIMACIAEGIHLSLRWYGTPDSSMVPFLGSQKLLIEVLDSNEKGSRSRTFEAPPLLVVQAPNGDRVCITYEEDDDDEMNRPVM